MILYCTIGLLYSIYAVIRKRKSENKEYPMMTIIIGLVFGAIVFAIDICNPNSYIRKDIDQLKHKYL